MTLAARCRLIAEGLNREDQAEAKAALIEAAEALEAAAVPDGWCTIEYRNQRRLSLVVVRADGSKWVLITGYDPIRTFATPEDAMTALDRDHGP